MATTTAGAPAVAPVGGGVLTVSGPSEERVRLTRMRVGEGARQIREESTKGAYGDFLNPWKNGQTKWFCKWCVAGPNEEVNGLKTDPGKVPYDPLPTHEVVLEYMETHLTKRQKMNKGKAPGPCESCEWKGVWLLLFF